MAHTHEFTVGKSGNVETCTCGRFRFTDKGLAVYPIVTEVRDDTDESDPRDNDALNPDDGFDPKTEDL